jgi:hypothetical protein
MSSPERRAAYGNGDRYVSYQWHDRSIDNLYHLRVPYFYYLEKYVCSYLLSDKVLSTYEYLTSQLLIMLLLTFLSQVNYGGNRAKVPYIPYIVLSLSA